MVDLYRLDKNSQESVTKTQKVVEATIAPQASETDANASFPTSSLAALADAGLYGLTVPTEYGGSGCGPAAFAAVTEEIAKGCASTAMIYVMHVASTQAIIQSDTLANRDTLLREIAAGRHLSTLAFSERGSRSHFWAPVSALTANGSGFRLAAEKSWVTSANHADMYVVSTQKPQASSPMESTILLVRRDSPGVVCTAGYDGLGLRGNDSAPVQLDNVAVSEGDLLTPQGAGVSMMLEVVLPWFVVGTSAMAHGLCLSAIEETTGHLTTAGFQTDGSRLCDLPNLRARLAEMNMQTQQSRALLGATLQSMQNPDQSTPLWVLQSRMSAMQAAVNVTDLAMKACGGAAFSKHLSIERLFRDARAGWVMAPTVDHLQDFVGRALCGMELF